MKRLVDAVAYQAVWFAAVLGAARGLAWPGVAAALVFTAAHLAAGPRAPKVTLMLLGIGCGLLLDGGLARAGWVRYAASGDAWGAVVGAPAWLLALWAVFPLTLTCSFSALQGRPALAAVLGAIGGPLAYWGAARGPAALAFVAPLHSVMAVLGVGWCLALSVLAWRAGGSRVRGLVGVAP